MIHKAVPAVIVILLCWTVSVQGGSSSERTASGPPGSPLPEGDTGLAAKYLGDLGIENDPAVVFTDNFEGGKNLRKKWDAAVWNESMRLLTDDSANAHCGKSALEFTLPRGGESSHGVMKKFSTGFEVIFMRYYIKFDKDDDFFNPAHDGGNIYGIADGLPISSPGVRADGKSRFSASLDTLRHDETTKPPGEWIVYCYYPDQDGNYGDYFTPKQKFLIERNRWYCCELMLKLNAVGKKDGRLAFWVDGKLIGDFPNLRLRDVDTLKINYIELMFYINNNNLRENKMWYDDVVAATSYIGPMAKERKAPPPPVANSAPKAPAPPPAEPIDAKSLAIWEGKLVKRVIQGVKDKECPKVSLKAVSTRDEIVKVTGADEKSLSVEVQGNTMPLPWSWLKAGDRLKLARAYLKGQSLEDHLLVAVFALADHNTQLADEHFALAQAADPAHGAALVAEVRSSLGLK